MKKIVLIISLLVLFAFTGYFIMNEAKPEGVKGPGAEALADKMLSAINYAGWDTLTAVKWIFRDQHYYVWDKKRNWVEVRWDDYRVLFSPSSLKGIAYKNDLPVEGEEQDQLIHKAWGYFANDSFWLAAPFKVRDPGTERSLVKIDDKEALLVQYNSGGVTPGDAYLWLLDETGLPLSWKMWVKIIPVGGMEFSWEAWSTYTNQVKLASKHRGLLSLEITGIATSNRIEDLAGGEDPFELLIIK